MIEADPRQITFVVIGIVFGRDGRSCPFEPGCCVRGHSRCSSACGFRSVSLLHCPPACVSEPFAFSCPIVSAISAKVLDLTNRSEAWIGWRSCSDRVERRLGVARSGFRSQRMTSRRSAYLGRDNVGLSDTLPARTRAVPRLLRSLNGIEPTTVLFQILSATDPFL